MFSRRSLFALLGSAALAPQAVVATPVRKLVNTFADYEPMQRYTHTAYGLGYVITREHVAAAYADPRGKFGS